MLKSELAVRIAERHRLFQRDADAAVDAVFDAIADALMKGDRVELRGFGIFTAKRRDARQGRNPRTGEAVAVEAKRVPRFQASRDSG